MTLFREILNRLPLMACGMGVIVLVVAFGAAAGETDQYLTWEITLADSSDALNNFLEEEIGRFLEKANRRTRPTKSAGELTIELYLHLFEGLHASRIRNWLKTSAEVDRYPSDELSDWEYQQMSIFRKPAFPYILPMAQTIRVGEVYLGIDKIGHMFGFGRRYFQRYHRALAEGDSHDEALERVLSWGIRHEYSLVGKLVDGVFSHGDMEANYQGFRLARALSSGEAPLFYREKGTWHFRGGIDIHDYVTPDFDESFNTNSFARWRERLVMPIVEARYHGASPPARFEAYQRGYHASLSKNFVDAWFEKRTSASRDDRARRP